MINKILDISIELLKTNPTKIKNNFKYCCSRWRFAENYLYNNIVMDNTEIVLQERKRMYYKLYAKQYFEKKK